MEKRISQADIARSVGVNASTVSRALRNDPRITEEVRTQVLKAAQQLGYHPDPAVSALANYRWQTRPPSFSGVVAWITVEQNRGEHRRKYPEFELYWKGANACADRFGYRIEEFTINQQTPLEKLEKILYARNVKGLLLPPEEQPYPEWEKLHTASYSIVRMSRTVHNLETHLVTTNQTADGILATRKMHELGYRRIGFVSYTHEDRLFYPGFAWGHHNRPDLEYIPPLFMNQVPKQDRPAVLRNWIQTHQPNAILEDLDGFHDDIEKAGYRIPEDICVATQNVLRNPNTAGILQNLEEVGRVSMLTLLSLIHDHDRGIPPIARQTLVKGQWIDGPSLPPRSGAAAQQ